MGVVVILGKRVPVWCPFWPGTGAIGIVEIFVIE